MEREITALNCLEHPKLLINYYCGIHDEIFCENCKAEKHGSCENVESIKQASKDDGNKDSMSQLISRMAEAKELLSTTTDKLEDNISVLNKQFNNITKNIRNARKSITDYFKSLEAELSSIVNDRCIKQVEEQIVELERRKYTLEQWEDDLQLAVRSDDEEVLFSRLKVLDRLQSDLEIYLNDMQQDVKITHVRWTPIRTDTNSIASFIGKISLAEVSTSMYPVVMATPRTVRRESDDSNISRVTVGDVEIDKSSRTSQGLESVTSKTKQGWDVVSSRVQDGDSNDAKSTKLNGLVDATTNKASGQKHDSIENEIHNQDTGYDHEQTKKVEQENESNDSQNHGTKSQSNEEGRNNGESADTSKANGSHSEASDTIATNRTNGDADGTHTAKENNASTAEILAQNEETETKNTKVKGVENISLVEGVDDNENHNKKINGHLSLSHSRKSSANLKPSSGRRGSTMSKRCTSAKTKFEATLLDQRLSTEVQKGLFLIDDELLFLDKGNKCIFICSKEGTVRNKIKLIYDPQDVALLDDEKAVVTLGHTGLQVIHIRTLKKEKFHDVGGFCGAVASHKGQVIVSVDNKLRLLDTLGYTLRRIHHDGCASFVATDDAGRIYYSDSMNHTVYCIAWYGIPVFIYSSRNLHFPMGITVDSDMFIYIAGFESNNVIKLWPNGRFHSQFLSEKDDLFEPSNISCNKETNELLLIRDNNQRIEIYDINENSRIQQ